MIMNPLIKIVDQKSIKTTIDIGGLAKIIIYMMIIHHDYSHSIFSDQDSLFTLQFESILFYFFNIKQKLSTLFHPQRDNQTEKYNRQ